MGRYRSRDVVVEKANKHISEKYPGVGRHIGALIELLLSGNFNFAL
jgi:hypothetical protein